MNCVFTLDDSVYAADKLLTKMVKCNHLYYIYSLFTDEFIIYSPTCPQWVM